MSDATVQRGWCSTCQAEVTIDGRAEEGPDGPTGVWSHFRTDTKVVMVPWTDYDHCTGESIPSQRIEVMPFSAECGPVTASAASAEKGSQE